MSNPTGDALNAANALNPEGIAMADTPIAAPAAADPPAVVDNTVDGVSAASAHSMSADDKRSMIASMEAQFHRFLDAIGVSKELDIAKQKMTEAVVWAHKHLKL